MTRILLQGCFLSMIKQIPYTLTGKAATSRQYNFDGKLNAGYHYNVAVGKTGRKFTIMFNEYLWDDKYDPNDLEFFPIITKLTMDWI